MDDLERRTAAYPDEVAERLIRMFSVKGELVLDPFLGSGTTTKVAMKNGRNSIGFELDSSLLPAINRKLEPHIKDNTVLVDILKR